MLPYNDMLTMLPYADLILNVYFVMVFFVLFLIFFFFLNIFCSLFFGGGGWGEGVRETGRLIDGTRTLKLIALRGDNTHMHMHTTYIQTSQLLDSLSLAADSVKIVRKSLVKPSSHNIAKQYVVCTNYSLLYNVLT